MNINLLPWREMLAKKRMKYLFFSIVGALFLIVVCVIIWQIKNQNVINEQQKIQQSLEQKLADITSKYVTMLNADKLSADTGQLPATQMFDIQGDVTNLTLDFDDIPVRELLMLLAEFNQANLVLSDTVQGNLTLHLKNVTWQQALDTVLMMSNLHLTKQGNIFMIAPISEIAEQALQHTASETLSTALIPLHYAKAADLITLLQAKTNGLLSDRGSVTADPRTNQIWIKDTPEVLKQVRTFLYAIDVPAKQVQIAARIVNVDESSIAELGLKFGTVSDTSSTGNSGELHMDMPLNINTGHFTVAIAKLGQGTLLDLELSALEREGHAHTISHPQLITANRQPAAIESGQEIPYQEKTISGDTNVAFKKAVLSLKVTPEITPENKILLSVTVNQDKVDALMVNGVPAISTQQVQSQILLNNGETIVLGGIYEQINKDMVERMPFFGSIPVLGKLFTYKETRADRKELLIFITPKMIE